MRSIILALTMQLAASAGLMAEEKSLQAPVPCGYCSNDDSGKRPVPKSSPGKGQIQGTVIFEKEPLPGTTMTLSDGKALTYTTVSNSTGKYFFVNLQPGRTYTIHAELEGFANRKPKKATARADGVVEVDFSMKLLKGGITIACPPPDLLELPELGQFVIRRELAESLPLR